MDDLNLIKKAVRIRLIEKVISDIYETDLIQSPLHLSIGQEAVAVGVCNLLNPQDKLFATYRSHAWFLAKGGSEQSFLSELMGKASGVCKSKGGSMHLGDASNGFMGTSAVVGGTIPHAVGAALSNKIKNETENLTLSVFGDGAMDQGVYHESLNFASLHSLPIVFILEDNMYAVHTKKEDRQSFNYINHATSYGIETFNLKDTLNPYSISEQMKNLYKIVRDQKRPIWVRIQTYRYKEHVGIGNDFGFGYRDESEFEAWVSQDPVQKYIENHYNEIKLIEGEILRLIKKVENFEFPSHEALLQDVF